MACLTKNGEYIPWTKRVDIERSWGNSLGNKPPCEISTSFSSISKDEKKKRKSISMTSSLSSSSCSTINQKKKRKIMRVKESLSSSSSSMESRKKKRKRRKKTPSSSSRSSKKSRRKKKRKRRRPQTSSSSDNSEDSFMIQKKSRRQHRSQKPEENLKVKKRRETLSHKQYDKNIQSHSSEKKRKRKKRRKKRLTKRSHVSKPLTVEDEDDFLSDEESKKARFPELIAGYVNRRTTNYLKLGYGKEETKFGLPDVECIRCGKTGHFFNLCPTLRR